MNLNKKFLCGYCENIQGECMMTVVFKYDSNNDTLVYIPLNELVSSDSGLTSIGYLNINDFFLDIDKRDLLNRISISAILSKGLFLNDKTDISDVPVYFGNTVGSSNIVFELLSESDDDVFYYTNFTFSMYTNKIKLSPEFKRVDSSSNVELSEELFHQILKKEQFKMKSDLLHISEIYSNLVKNFKVQKDNQISWIN